MTRSEVVRLLARRTRLPQARVDAALRLMFAHIIRTVAAGGRVEIRGFGTLGTRRLRARASRNPRRGVAILLPESRLPHFRLSKVLRRCLSRALRGGGGPQPNSSLGVPKTQPTPSQPSAMP